MSKKDEHADHDHAGHEHDHEHGHDHDDEDEDDGTVVLVDADGNEAVFGILGFVDVDEAEYALLAPIEQLEDEEAEGELDVFIYRYEEYDDGETFSPVDDGEEFERVREIAATYLEEAQEAAEGEE